MEHKRTRVLYGVADLVLAALYAYVILALAPARSVPITAGILAMAGVSAAGGVGMLVSAPWGRRVALWASLILLCACVALVVALASSAAYLHGIYGGVGQAGSAIALLAAAVVVEVVGLAPALQLAYLRRTAPRSGGRPVGQAA